MITAEKNIVKFKAKDGREVTIRPAQASDAEHITTAVREIIEAGEFIQKMSRVQSKKSKILLHQ